MFAFMQKLISDYTYYKSGMVKKEKNMKTQIDKNMKNNTCQSNGQHLV